MIEMVMVIAIMAIMFTVGAASYSDYQRRQYLDSAVSMIEDDIKLARQLSLSGSAPTGCNELNGYSIHVFEHDGDGDGTNDPDENIYHIGAVCENEWCNKNLGTDYCVKEAVRMPAGIEISNVPGFPSSMVTFLTLGRGLGEGMHPAPTSDVGVITLSYTNGSVPDRTITILPGGGVRVD
jgi:type II secretory pathway pseudopilin PulG